MINFLTKLANTLDQLKEYEKANEVDRLIQKIAQQSIEEPNALGYENETLQSISPKSEKPADANDAAYYVRNKDGSFLVWSINNGKWSWNRVTGTNHILLDYLDKEFVYSDNAEPVWQCNIPGGERWDFAERMTGQKPYHVPFINALSMQPDESLMTKWKTPIGTGPDGEEISTTDPRARMTGKTQKRKTSGNPKVKEVQKLLGFTGQPGQRNALDGIWGKETNAKFIEAVKPKWPTLFSGNKFTGNIDQAIRILQGMKYGEIDDPYFIPTNTRTEPETQPLDGSGVVGKGTRTRGIF